ncbi:MAG TPA: indolepyruvate ferredoxin oxidoreductase subunit alpha [Beijerinckiaceae bacterium]|nr:indolepyruvate ferredoxin oxidoreductase subunit alpha [Beijerinckiaceae bacterium]
MAAEVSFKKEIESLKLGQGETFYGEGILAVTKALLQSGVAYVGGYQGAPVSHLLDVLVEAEDLLKELGVHLETCTNEAAAAAMLAASISYPLRGAVTWKSIVGTNVAADALSNLASAGVMGGALIILGEDYGEGASVIQERSHAYALKSSLWLLDPRPDLPTIVRMVENAFELSEASRTPVMMELRIRACHVFGSFEAKNNVAAAHSAKTPFAQPAKFDYSRLSHPPFTFIQERDKLERRLPAAQRFIVDRGLNEILGSGEDELGVIVQGGLFNVLNGRLALAGLSDIYGNPSIDALVLNVVHPLAPDQIVQFCAKKHAVLIVEEGSPDYLEQAIGQILRKADVQTKIYGKDALPAAGEYTPLVLGKGLAHFLRENGRPAELLEHWIEECESGRREAAGAPASLPMRPPTFCTGCPERPVFSAMKLLRQESGPVHIAADIGCHAFGTFAPFDQGNSILGYGMSLASAAAVSSTQTKRPISIMGDGGFWHNGLITGVTGAVFNKDDSVLVIMKNGYSSATGTQDIPSSVASEGRGSGLDIEKALRSVGVKWVKRVRTYGVSNVLALLREATTTKQQGLKVIIADGECQLARQRRIRPLLAKAVGAGKRIVRSRFWVDPDICTGDHSCIRLSGCPSLSVKPSEDPLRSDPIAHVDTDCVGCGLCGEVAHAAQLCPSFAQIDVIQNPNWFDRMSSRMAARLLRRLAPGPGSTLTGAPAE